MTKITFMTLADARAHDPKAFDKAIYAAIEQGVAAVGARAFVESLSRPVHEQTAREIKAA